MGARAIRIWTTSIAAFATLTHAHATIQLKSTKRQVFSHKVSSFPFTYKNTGSTPVILTPEKKPTAQEECRPSRASYAAPILPGETRTLIVECEFMAAGTSAEFRSTSVRMTAIVDGRREPVALQVQTTVRLKPLIQNLGTLKGLDEKTVVRDADPQVSAVDPYAPNGVVFEWLDPLALHGGQPAFLAQDCERLQKAVLPLLEAKEKMMGARIQNPACECRSLATSVSMRLFEKNGTRLCSVKIESLLPETIRQDLGRYPICNGPNCWNATLKTLGFLDLLRYTNEEEVKFHLNSPLCRELGVNEAPNLGDVIRIQQGSGRQDIHSFVYLTPNLVYTKNGANHKAPYTLDTPLRVLDGYHVRKDCRRVDLRSSRSRKECQNGRYARIYRCSPLSKAQKNSMIGANPELRNASQKIDSLECIASSRALKGLDVTFIRQSEEIDRLLDQILPIVSHADLIGENDEYLRQSILMRMQSIGIQNRILRELPRD